jgi:hypothetical protein
MGKLLSWIGAFIAIILLASFIGNATRTPADTAREAKTDQHIKFSIACERLAKKQLKSPSTAEFADISQELREIIPTANGLTWDGWVDSENSFGANLRSYFICDYNETSDKIKVTFTR